MRRMRTILFQRNAAIEAHDEAMRKTFGAVREVCATRQVQNAWDLPFEREQFGDSRRNRFRRGVCFPFKQYDMFYQYYEFLYKILDE